MKYHVIRTDGVRTDYLDDLGQWSPHRSDAKVYIGYDAASFVAARRRGVAVLIVDPLTVDTLRDVALRAHGVIADGDNADEHYALLRELWAVVMLCNDVVASSHMGKGGDTPILERGE